MNNQVNFTSSEIEERILEAKKNILVYCQKLKELHNEELITTLEDAIEVQLNIIENLEKRPIEDLLH